jgi:hypothetical protein
MACGNDPWVHSCLEDNLGPWMVVHSVKPSANDNLVVSCPFPLNTAGKNNHRPKRVWDFYMRDVR